MDIEIDFSELSQRDGDYPDGITQFEVVSVLENQRHKLAPIENYPLKDCYTVACGYSSKKRILLVVSMIEYPKRKILQVKVADEEEIDHFYCGKG